MERQRVVARAWTILFSCALGAASLALGLSAFRALRMLARIADRRDAIAILENANGGFVELFAALARAEAHVWLRVLGALALFIVFARRVWRRRSGCVALAFVVALAVIVCWQTVADRRHATRTLCWAASSGVYDRPTREHALVRGRALLDTTLGRLIGRFDRRAQKTCDDAARTLGVSAQ